MVSSWMLVLLEEGKPTDAFTHYTVYNHAEWFFLPNLWWLDQLVTCREHKEANIHWLLSAVTVNEFRDVWTCKIGITPQCWLHRQRGATVWVLDHVVKAMPCDYLHECRAKPGHFSPQVMQGCPLCGSSAGLRLGQTQTECDVEHWKLKHGLVHKLETVIMWLLRLVPVHHNRPDDLGNRSEQNRGKTSQQLRISRARNVWFWRAKNTTTHEQWQPSNDQRCLVNLPICWSFSS